MSMTAAPMKPSSSQVTEKIKSLCSSGRYRNFCRLPPRPRPLSPPEPIVYSDWTIWYPSSEELENGSRHVLMRVEA